MIKRKIKILAVVFAFVVAAGSVATGLLLNKLDDGSKFEAASLVSSKNTKNPKSSKRNPMKIVRRPSAVSKSGRKLLAQLETPAVILDPLTVCVYTLPKKPEYKAEFVAKEMEAWAPEGGEFETTFYVKNTGNAAWFGDSSGCGGADTIRLGSARERDHASLFYNPADLHWVSPARISMVESRVNPGEIGTFRFVSRVPYESDIYREYFQPVIEGKQWLEDAESTARLDVFVGEVPEGYDEALFYLGMSGQASTIDPSGELLIDVDISDQTMKIMLGTQQIRQYRVSTGTFKTPTPLGRFKILNKQELRIGAKAPHYRMPQWQGFTKWGHGFHSLPYLANDNGTFWSEALNHIGQRVSHGCVRILPDDAKDFYSLTQVGTAIIIHN